MILQEAKDHPQIYSFIKDILSAIAWITYILNIITKILIFE